VKNCVILVNIASAVGGGDWAMICFQMSSPITRAAATDDTQKIEEKKTDGRQKSK